nr:hypothetical protein [Tanacetum cinerariifolium]
MAKSLASHISSNGRSQFGAFKIGASVSFFFNVWKAWIQSSKKTNGVSFLRRPRKASASSKSRKSLSPNGVSVGEVVETIGSSEGVGLPLA